MGAGRAVRDGEQMMDCGVNTEGRVGTRRGVYRETEDNKPKALTDGREVKSHQILRV